MVITNAVLLLLACVTQIVSGLSADSEKVSEQNILVQEDSGSSSTNLLRKNSVRSEPDPELHTAGKEDSADSIVFVEKESSPVTIPLDDRRLDTDFEFDDTSIITPSPVITPAVHSFNSIKQS